MRGGLWFRSLLPLLLVGMCLLVWFESFLTPLKVVTERFGADFFLRFCLGFLCLYVLLLWGENLRLNAMVKSVLTALQDFAKARRAELGTDSKRLEAMRLLVAALGSPDDKVRDGKRSLELSKKACEVTEYKQPHILSTLAACYAESGDFDSAKKWSGKAVDLGKGEMKEHLQKELDSYKEGKPWRERQQMDEKPNPPALHDSPTL